MKSEPYYQREGVTLYLGDCREVLPTLASVDCVVTSPPYNTLPTAHHPSGIHGQRKTGVNQWIARAVKGYFDSMPEPEYQGWLVGILQSCVELCRGLVWVNHKIRYREGTAIHPVRMFPWPLYSEVIWDRMGSLALNCKRYAPSTEHLLGFGRPYVWNDEHNKLMSVWRLPFDREDNEHPCAYPVELARRPIASSTNEGDSVLDPFMGTGTTGAAALNLGRRFIGIEIEERWCEHAAQRLDRLLSEPRLPFVEEQQPAEQKGLWE